MHLAASCSQGRLERSITQLLGLSHFLLARGAHRKCDERVSEWRLQAPHTTTEQHTNTHFAAALHTNTRRWQYNTSTSLASTGTWCQLAWWKEAWQQRQLIAPPQASNTQQCCCCCCMELNCINSDAGTKQNQLHLFLWWVSSLVIC